METESEGMAKELSKGDFLKVRLLHLCKQKAGLRVHDLNSSRIVLIIDRRLYEIRLGSQRHKMLSLQAKLWC